MHPKELPIPEAAATSDNARELTRVWAANGAMHLSLATGLWKDPATWGIVLVDLARHVARAYEQTTGTPAADTLKRIFEGFEAERSKPTDSPIGSITK
jgi:hypothetical protein